MTTASKQVRASSGAGTLLGAASWALPVGVAVALVGLAVDGTSALGAGLAGAVATVLVLAGGALAVDVVARIMPAASLLLALLTYVFQVLVLTVALAAVARAADGTVTRWAAAALIAVTLAWTFAHLLLATRRRVAVYDVALPGEHAEGAEVARAGRPARTASPSDGVSGATGAGAR